jgi:short-subunit dehydrogenase
LEPLFSFVESAPGESTMIDSSDPADRRVVLVTGATSGIGQATGELLASQGYRVYGTSRHPQGKTTCDFELLQLDVTSDISVERCVSEISERTNGRIDVLVNNAGTGIFGAVEEVSHAEALALFEINFFGVMRMTSAVLPLMRARRSGKIINMSSSGGLASLPFAGIYCATKFALEAYTAALFHEVRPLGISATVVAPGPVSTPAGDQAMRAARVIDDYTERRRKTDEMGVDAIRNGIDPRRVAKAILKVIWSKHPAPRYPVGLQARMTGIGRSLLPPSVFQAAVRRVTRQG